MSTVNEVNVAKWVVALRSGKYTQAKERLRTTAGAMCCLGVACDISGLGTWEPSDEPFQSPTDIIYSVPDGDDSGEVLPDDVAQWLFNDTMRGRFAKNPRIRDDDPHGRGEVESAEANDRLDWDFFAIANAIERTYLPGKKAEEILAAIPA